VRWLACGMLWVGGLLAPAAVEACSCLPIEDVTKEFDKYAVIFLGEAVEERAAGEHSREAAFRVAQVWKGQRAKRLTVGSASQAAACGYPFQAGRHYVVFAHATRATLSTNSCSPTARMKVAEELIGKLDRHFGVKTTLPEEKPSLR
jgi:hypothetical protein